MVALLHVWAGVLQAGLLVPSMQADVIDYDELHTGQRREAQFTAFWAMVPARRDSRRCVALAVLGMIGYVPNADQTRVLMGIRDLYALVPATLRLRFLALLYPLNQEVHTAIRAGIDAHKRGEEAIDPLTRRVVLPPGARAVDAETSWFLDFFAPGELRHALAHGPGGVRTRVIAKVALCAVLFAVALELCLTNVSNLGQQPGLTAVLAVVGAGFALTGVAFHLMRLGPAARLAREPIAPELIRAHLDQVRPPARASDRDAELLRRAS